MPDKNYLPIQILHDFAERIERLNIAYMLTGSMAMMNYSLYRFTADVNVVLELKSEDAKRIIGVFEPDYYVPHNAVSRAIFSEKMFNVIHHETAFKIDCVIKKQTAFQEIAFERRSRTDFYGRKIWIITKEDLIISKLLWAKDSLSEKQLTDVKNLAKTGFDAGYVEKWTNELGVYKLLAQCRKEIEE
ncbi:MAG: hypothetical protein LH614_12825 [Pyrinomonadaceae bacterium]|nr:hypothetical protein [Pyrinomonadaceae bacterium]